MTTLGEVLSKKLDALPRPLHFLFLALCVFFFFGIHNILQEAMINTDGFSFGIMLGWMEVLGVTLCSGLERSSAPWIGNGEAGRPRMAPLCAYPPLTLSLLLSSSLASLSLNYINFPTKVVFRSCKLLPTMLLAFIMGNANRFSAVEVGSAVSVCMGLIIFTAGDWSLKKPRIHPFGLTLVTLSVFADAFLPNAQQKLFRAYDASKSEVMFHTNALTLAAQTGTVWFSGDLTGMFRFVMGRNQSSDTSHNILHFPIKESLLNSTASAAHENLTGLHLVSAVNNDYVMLAPEHPTEKMRLKFLSYMIAYILISHVAVSAHTVVVRKFGGVAAVFVGTARKAMTLLLSFLLFPKESNWKYVAGAILVLGGLTVASLEKQINKRGKNDELEKVLSYKVGSSACKGPFLAPVLSLSSASCRSAGSSRQGSDYDEPKFRSLLKEDLELGRSSSAAGAGRRRL